MATSSHVQLDAALQPVFYTALKEESAKKASELLQENHENHHIFFNTAGFHNHIAHQLLSLYALGARPDQLQRGYDENKTYQTAQIIEKEQIDLSNPEVWKQSLGVRTHYRAFLLFFQKELEAKGAPAVINEYLFSGDERAEDMLVRLHEGFLHPLIHVGFGVEFSQPAILAEGLAQTAVHTTKIGRYLVPAEEAAKKTGAKKMEKSIVKLLEECQANEKLKNSPHWSDDNKVHDGIIGRAADEMMKIASQVVIGEDEIEEKTAEMMNATIYFTAAAQRPSKSVKMDFYYMHSVNSSIFFPALLGPSSPLSTASKQRLLEWKIRMDLALYASRKAPPLLLNEINSYRAKQPSGWDECFERVKNYKGDDGHAAKMMRQVAAAEQICKKYEGNDAFRIHGDMYLKIGHMIIDSVEGYGGEDEPRWGRSVGFDEAWEKIPDRPMAVL